MGLWEEIARFGPEGGEWADGASRDVPLSIGSEIPGDWDFLSTERRFSFVAKYSWAVPSKKAINKVKKFVGERGLLEVGAGKGLWAKLLQDDGVNVTATDLMRWTPVFDPSVGLFAEVIRMDGRDAAKSLVDHEALMLVWPPYDEPMAFDTLSSFVGNRLVFVGEGDGGCTADRMFFELLESKWELQDVVKLPQWPGIHDRMELWDRASQPVR